ETEVVQAPKQEPKPAPEPELVAEPSVPEPIVEPKPELVSEQPETAPAPKSEPEPAKLADSVAAPTAAEPLVEPMAPTAEIVETQSATMQFFSTFLDFFKPPNTTGVVRTVKRDPEQKNVNVSQQSSRSAVAPRDGGVEANVLAQQLKDLEQQQKEFLVNNPPQEPPAQETNKEIELVFEENVEPKQDTIPDPFADPTNVDKLEAKLPPHPSEEDKIATDLPDGLLDDGGDKTIAPDELAGLEGILDGAPPPADTPPPADDLSGLEGLLDSTDESQTANLDGTPTDEDWALKELDSASLPDVAIPSASDIVASGEILEDVQLALGEDVHVGQEFTENRLQLMKIETIHRPCVDKHGDGTLFCIDTIFWPLDIEENFRVDTIMYQGTRAIARYDDGVATNFHAMFNSGAFDIIANYYTNRYGAPTKSIARAIAPFAKPRKENPTMIWQSREPGTDLIVSLEIRKFDDARGGFPDTERGVVMLYKNHAEPIFPKLSQLELMVLEPDDKATANLAPSEPATPDSVW
ncbi:MAG: hypothetical protein KAQ66_05900, partial [Rhodospirillaceae bacterium]|nr:hypothetical protein [Rhodospirillaceae bacterium]